MIIIMFSYRVYLILHRPEKNCRSLGVQVSSTEILEEKFVSLEVCPFSSLKELGVVLHDWKVGFR
jgi:hypothetical protein